MDVFRVVAAEGYRSRLRPASPLPPGWPTAPVRSSSTCRGSGPGNPPGSSCSPPYTPPLPDRQPSDWSAALRRPSPGQTPYAPPQPNTAQWSRRPARSSAGRPYPPPTARSRALNNLRTIVSRESNRWIEAQAPPVGGRLRHSILGVDRNVRVRSVCPELMRHAPTSVRAFRLRSIRLVASPMIIEC
jgi:hypothetical protein